MTLRLRVDEVWRLPGRLDVDDAPVGIEAPRHARSAGEQRLRPRRVGGEADQHPTRGADLALGRSASGSRAVEALRHLAQGKLTQRGEVRVLEEVLERPGDLVARVDLSLLQALLQVL